MNALAHRLTPALLTAAAALTATLAMSGTASAAKGTGVRIADFNVQLEGVQETYWEHHHIAEGGCDVPYDGSGEETYRFHSKKLHVRAMQTPSGVVLIGMKGSPELRLSGTVKRDGKLVVGTSEQICSYGDGTGAVAPPKPPDCGTRKVHSSVEIGFASRTPDQVIISDGADTTNKPFANCPTGVSEQFPEIMAFDGKNNRIGQRLPARDLFRYGKNIVIARGTKVTRVPETTATTTVRWTASFTRIKKKG